MLIFFINDPCWSLQSEHQSLTVIATKEGYKRDITLCLFPIHSIYSPCCFFWKHSERLISPLECLPEAGVSLAKRAFSKCCWNCFRFSSTVLKYSRWEKHLASEGRAAWRELLMSLPIYLLTHRYQLEWCQIAEVVLPINCEWSPESVSRPQSLISGGGLGWIGLALNTVMLYGRKRYKEPHNSRIVKSWSDSIKNMIWVTIMSLYIVICEETAKASEDCDQFKNNSLQYES